MQELPGKELFTENLNSNFFLAQEGSEQIVLELVELKNGYSDRLSEAYSLLFRGPAAFVLPQRLYPLRHAALGEFDLFLVPVGKDAAGAYYEAVFNQLRKT